MTTAKRLAALERASELAKAARVEARQATIDRAWRRLTRADLDTLTEMHEASKELIAAVIEASKPYLVDREQHAPLFDWIDAADRGADDDLFPLAPMGAAAQFEEWLTSCEAVLQAGESLTGALLTAYRWNVVEWRWWASLAREVGEVAG